MRADGPPTVLLARHGRTPLNAQGRLRGRLDPPLDEVGLAEVSRLGAALAAFGPTRVLTSPLLRARQTAFAIAEQAGGTPVLVDGRLADRDYGPAAGLTVAEVEARWGSLDAVPGIEAEGTLTARALAVLAELHDATAPGAPTGTVVLVAHDAVNRALLAALPPHYGRDRPVSQRTGCWNVLHATRGSWLVTDIDVVAPHTNG